MHYEAFISCGPGKLLHLSAGARQPYHVAVPHELTIGELLEDVVFPFHANLAGLTIPRDKSYMHFKAATTVKRKEPPGAVLRATLRSGSESKTGVFSRISRRCVATLAAKFLLRSKP